MGFIGISIDNYVKRHLKNNPSANKKDLRDRLISAMAADQNGVKCSCGNDIWVVGSASVGNSCFTCITGENRPGGDYEIDSVLKRRQGSGRRRHIDEMDMTKICGIFDDDGYEINTDLIKKPSICLICMNDGDAKEELLCNMIRFDQRKDDEFKCSAFRKKING
jgi:hypothetical protein